MTKLQLATALAGIAGFATAAFGQQDKTQTAQGIMVNLTTAGDYAIVSNIQYKFNLATADGYFTNAWDGNAPAVSCSGPGCPGTAPAAPAAPAPLAGQTDAAAKNNECAFANGGALAGSSYTQTAKIATGSKSTAASFTYTYTYAVTPTTTTVAPLTAWDFVQQTGSATTAHIDINANIAGESVVVSKQFASPGKFSFSLLDSDGVTNRVQNLAVTVTDSTGAAVASAAPASTVVQNAPGAQPGQPGAVDFTYNTNAGSNGATGLLNNGDARSILNTDVFSGNNDGGADGSALAMAVMDAIGVDLGAGDYTITLTGTVKGNSATASISFTISSKVHIILPGLGSCPTN